ncbi:MAG: hypothetical protein AAFV45_04165 [Pseudomonadota bacterium]
MIIEPIGFVALILGVLILRQGPNFGLIAIIFASLLGTAAAIKLPALGGSSVVVAHFLMPFYVVSVARTLFGVPGMLYGLTANWAGFILLCFTVYGTLTAFFIPRIFAGQIEVFAITRDAAERSSIVVTPLAFGSGNITQTVYLIGDLVMFAAVFAHVRALGIGVVIVGFALAAFGNFTFGMIDWLTDRYGMTELLAPIRNANYAIVTEGTVGGIRRMIGSFPEPSSFGTASLVLFALMFEFYLAGFRRRIFGWLAALQFCVTLFSLSSSTLAGLSIYLALVSIRGGVSLAISTVHKRQIVLMAAALSLALAIALLMVSFSGLLYWGAGIIDRVLLNKLESESGIERTLWNLQGLAAFWETAMLGAGVGSIRTSSYFVALLANTGLIGTMLMFGFFIALVRSAYGSGQSRTQTRLARCFFWACIAALLPVLLAGTAVGLGLMFATLSASVVALRAKDDQDACAVPPLLNFQHRNFGVVPVSVRPSRGLS